MISYNYHEEIKWNKDFSQYEVLSKTDIATGKSVCVVCDEIIEGCENEDNGGKCDYCSAIERADRALAACHPDEDNFYRRGYYSKERA